MAEISFTKIAGNLFEPCTESDAEKARKIPVGKVITAEWKRKRNYEFFKKYWALIDYAFDCWEPGDASAAKNREKFRDDLTILAGYYDEYYSIDGTLKLTAKSISFGKMREEDFEKLYSNTIDVILKHVLRNYTKQDLEQVLANILGFS